MPAGDSRSRRTYSAAHTDRYRPARGGRPGEIRVAIGGASDRLPLQGSFTLAGAERTASAGRVLDTPVLVSDG